MEGIFVVSSSGCYHATGTRLKEFGWGSIYVPVTALWFWAEELG